MPHKEKLLYRLEEIGESLKKSNNAVALIGLGSVGNEISRIDEYSDLDFFAVVKDGHKQNYINDLSWLSDICALAYVFRNTGDGYKLLFEDGIFCEMAVFEPHELSNIPFTEGRIIWKSEWIQNDIHQPKMPVPAMHKKETEWLLGEALTNLYVGLGRFHRGEKLSAYRFIQNYALDRVLELASEIENEKPVLIDPFVLDRRFEQRFPKTANELQGMIQGYEKSRESAKAILEFLDRHFSVNEAMKKQILALC